ncbi:MAG: sporulation integral membrane protein YtvI [Bacillota bacterium]
MTLIVNKRLIPYLQLLVFVVGWYLVLRYLLPFVTPFLAAAILAFVLEGPVNMLTRNRVPRGAAVAVSLVVVLAVLAGIFLVAVAKLAAELVALSRQMPNYLVTVQAVVDRYLEEMGTLPPPVRTLLETQYLRLFGALQGLIEFILSAVRVVPGTVISAIITVVATFFISRDGPEINKFLMKLLPKAWRAPFTKVKANVLFAVLGLLKGQLILMTIATTLSATGLYLIGVEYALVVGLLVALVDLIPVIGPSVIFWPWILWHMLFGNIVFAILLALVYASVSLLRPILEPRIIGAQIGIHPLATLIAIYLGIKLFGVSGFIIGPLSAIVIKAAVTSGFIPLLDD